MTNLFQVKLARNVCRSPDDDDYRMFFVVQVEIDVGETAVTRAANAADLGAFRAVEDVTAFRQLAKAIAADVNDVGITWCLGGYFARLDENADGHLLSFRKLPEGFQGVHSSLDIIRWKVHFLVHVIWKAIWLNMAPQVELLRDLLTKQT